MKKLLISLVLVLVPSIVQATTLAVDGAYCWFQDPRAIYSNNKTFYGSVDTEGDIEVRRYNHATGTVDQTALLKDNFNIDDHTAPSLYLTPNGKITVFWSAHNGDKISYRTTANAGDLSSWGTSGLQVPTQGGDHDYSNPQYLANEGGGKTFLFWRGEAELPTLITSTNVGTASTPTWTTARNFFDTGFRRPYLKIVGDGDRTIHFFASKSHPVNVAHNSLYHFYYNGGYFYKSDGTLIKSVSQAAANPFSWDDVTRVYNATTNGNQAWNWDIALDEGNPVVSFATMDTDQTDHVYHVSRWDGSAWNDNTVTTGGQWITQDPSFYSGGIVLDHENPDIAYLSTGSGNDFDLEKWTWDGTAWVQDSVVASDEENIRPVVPRNHHPDLPVIWMGGEYTYFKPFQGGMYDTGLFSP